MHACVHRQTALLFQGAISAHALQNVTAWNSQFKKTPARQQNTSKQRLWIDGPVKMRHYNSMWVSSDTAQEALDDNKALIGLVSKHFYKLLATVSSR